MQDPERQRPQHPAAWTMDPASFVQVEITTVCNFACFYCAGRAMAQRHMSPEAFAQVLARLPQHQPGVSVSLQGEGEPTLHPQFWGLVEAVLAQGLRPYTITNATRIDIDRFDRLLPLLGVSVDTLDPREAERIGRYNLAKVLDNLGALLARMGPSRLLVHTVDYGQPLAPLRTELARLGLRHLVQPLQRKADYLRHYPVAVRQPLLAGVSFRRGDPIRPARHCSYLATPRMRYFTIDGVELPCCFIKDVPADFSADALRRTLAEGGVPPTCQGCRELH